MLLEKLLRESTNSPRVHLRDALYGMNGQTQLLQEVLGLANADTTGPRHICFGAIHEGEGEGELKFTGLNDKDLIELETYLEVVRRYIEPELRLESIYDSVAGNLVAALEITRCNNPPYVLKMDANREMRRGDCWVSEGGLFRPAQRADLDRMYRSTAQNAPQPTSNNIVHVGLGDSPENQKITLAIPDNSRPPSSGVASRMQHQISARKEAVNVNVEDTGLARLVHARLYGNEQPYEEHGINTLVEGYNTVLDDNRDADNYYFYEQQAVKLNLSLVNTGHEPLEDVSFLLILPWAEQFKVADRLYLVAGGNQLSVNESELMGYPRVKQYKSSVQVKHTIDFLQPDEVVQVFEQDLRIAVKPILAGRKVAVRYSLTANGFDKPEVGRVKIQFAKP